MSEHDQAQATAREAEQDEKGTRVERPDDRGGRGEQQRRHGGRRRHAGRQSQQPGQPQQRRAEPTFNMEELRELTELFTAHGLSDLEFENEEIRVRLSRSLAQPAAVGAPVAAAGAAPPHSQAAPPPQGAPAAQAGAATTAEPAAPPEETAEDPHIITSPIVGTFYRAPSPNTEAFVKPGSHVEPESVVCIIEAMKLMNEIQAETTGTVEKIYVENGQPVEYGQPLFGVKK